MTHQRQIYLLDPQELSPETIAVTFAKTSRSPESFREIAAELTEAKSAEFNEKWVVGYGHSSVAEHAVLHIALENISRLAVENLESNRLASYTEKSTRYQTWSGEAFFVPSELDTHPLRDTYIQTCQLLFATYRDCLEKLEKHLLENEVQHENEKTAQYERRMRSAAIDVCRFMLPASSLANVGLTINARALEHAIGKLLSAPLEETRQIGTEIKAAARESVPTLLKYADEIPYLQTICTDFSSLELSPSAESNDWCQIVHYEPDAMERLLAAALYREQNNSYAQCLSAISTLSVEQKRELIHCLLDIPDPHTIPSRELENVVFTFDLMLDQGAYFEVKRHRMMTQTPQHLTAELGYAVPRAIFAAGLLDKYAAAMQEARNTYRQIANFDPHVAAYVVPNGFNRRVLLTVNLRSLVHFIRLRSATNAHFSVRRVAQRMAEEVTAQLPELANLLGRNELETSQSVEDAYFYSSRL